MMRKAVSHILAAAAVVAMPASPVLAYDRDPVGKWVVDYADHECLMSRQFGTVDDPLVLVIREMPMTNGATLSVIHKSDNRNHSWGSGHIRFGTKDAPAKVDYSAYGLTKDKLRRISIPLTTAQMASAEKAGRVEINIPHEIDESFNLASLAAVLRAGDQCAIELGEEWGFPPQEQARIASAPAGSLLPFIASDDYPSAALRNHEQGEVEARLTIDTTGKPTDCTIIKGSDSDSLDWTTCRIAMKRARFTPALDVDGKPVRGLLVIRVRWLMP